MAEKTATECNSGGDLSWTNIVLNSLFDYFSRKYHALVREDEMDQYVFERAYHYYYGQSDVVTAWQEGTPLPFFVTRAYDTLVEKGELPKLHVQTAEDACAHASALA